MNMLPGCLAVAMAASGAGAAHAQSVVTGDNGLPLYIFDQDRDGKSVCYQRCAHDWPPLPRDNGQRPGRRLDPVQAGGQHHAVEPERQARL